MQYMGLLLVSLAALSVVPLARSACVPPPCGNTPPPGKFCENGIHPTTGGTYYYHQFCLPNTWCAGGATCGVPCPTNSFSVAGASSSSQCITCSAGYAWIGSKCTACPGSGYAAGAGAQACTTCQAGNYSIGFVAECSLCPAGSICPNTATSTPTPCPVRQYSAPGATSCTTCSNGGGVNYTNLVEMPTQVRDYGQ